MAAMQQDRDTDRYTPQVVERLLRDLPYLLDNIAPRDRDMPRQGKHNSPEPAHIRFEDRMAKRADIESVLCSLPMPTYRIVYLCCVGGMSLRDVADVVGYSHTTVRHHKVEGLKWMAWRLGWRDPERGWS